jgi:hypothetical protein
LKFGNWFDVVVGNWSGIEDNVAIGKVFKYIKSTVEKRWGAKFGAYLAHGRRGLDVGYDSSRQTEGHSESRDLQKNIKWHCSNSKIDADID